MQPRQDSLTPSSGRISLHIAVTAISGDQQHSSECARQFAGWTMCRPDHTDSRFADLSSIVYVNQLHSLRLELPIRPTRRTCRSQIEGAHDGEEQGTLEALSARDAVTKAREKALKQPKKSATKVDDDTMWYPAVPHFSSFPNRTRTRRREIT